MRQAIALIQDVQRRSKMASGGVGLSAVPIGNASSALPFGEVFRLLLNWSRWAAGWRPELGVQEPPVFEMWRPYNDPEFRLWGESVPESKVKVNEADAVMIDKTLCPTATRLPVEHLIVLKRHFINFDRQPRDKLSAAVRALGDILGA